MLSAFAEKTGLVTSNGEARRQIKGGGLKVNDATVTDDKLAFRNDLSQSLLDSRHSNISITRRSRRQLRKSRVEFPNSCVTLCRLGGDGRANCAFGYDAR